MNFPELLKNTVHANRMVNMELTSDWLIPNVYEYSYEQLLQPHSLHLLAGGNICTDFPVSFSFRPINCCLLLFTAEGGGQITSFGQTLTATDRQLILFDCNQAFTLRSLVLPWNFKLFFISPKNMNLYIPYLKSVESPCFSIPELSPVNRSINTLLSVRTRPDCRELLLMHKALTDIFCELFLSLQPDSHYVSPDIPDYLYEMWDHLERHYEEPFTLEQFEERLGISKYRLCREFSGAYGMPPLKYLTDKRLKEAQKMLLTTDLTIHEISSKIGYENVNHFINLFKKYVGLTPKQFRQKALQEQPVLHCPSQ